MALYIPLIGGTGGNVGTQSSALVVQGLANSSLDAKNTFKQVSKEAVVALINATIISLLVYTYNFIRFGATATVTYSVSISLFLHLEKDRMLTGSHVLIVHELRP